MIKRIKLLHCPGIEPGAGRMCSNGNDPGYHYPNNASNNFVRHIIQVPSAFILT